ncbi:hypothetical protein DAPPUDRAFT_273777 [Daphnia pulex]|uniref:Uncharacterized protein n=1 Tax=Daphnia pulex TaxID=6669 RepID=E9I3P7_DAPPU|nr:hypothetical protein DAPPUDRAFT_273777 [Daphnia pulex]|eukprot:EFX61383.1 hypothetical protein DAPPUDRAFT_273777 [Daphnia pulex]
MEAGLALHCFRHTLEPQEKMQSFFNLRKTHYSMRFARNKHIKVSPEHSPETTCFPVVVNNRLRSFRSERCAKFEDDLESPDSPERSARQRSPLRRKVPREPFCLDRKEKPLDSPSSMFETIKIKRVGLAAKETDMRRTDFFKSRPTIYRKDSLMTVLAECERRKGKSLKR